MYDIIVNLLLRRGKCNLSSGVCLPGELFICNTKTKFSVDHCHAFIIRQHTVLSENHSSTEVGFGLQEKVVGENQTLKQ